MAKLNIAFLINPADTFEHDGDTSFSIMSECQARGHRIWYLESQDLVLYGNKLHGRVTPFGCDPKKGLQAAGPARMMNLHTLDCLLVRKEPPFDADYLYLTHLLDVLKPDVFMMNDPSGIRNTNEKLSILSFGAFIPTSVTAYDPALLRLGLRKFGLQDFVMKPLDQKGGVGVQKFRAADLGFEAQARALSHNGAQPVMVQRFVQHEHTGDKRILLLGGKVLGAFTRFPGKDDFRANMSRGGAAAKAGVTAQERRLVRALAPLIKKNGLHLTGIDVLDGRLTEINVTSPAGIPEINEFNGTRLERTVVNYLESHSK